MCVCVWGGGGRGGAGGVGVWGEMPFLVKSVLFCQYWIFPWNSRLDTIGDALFEACSWFKFGQW